MSPEILECQRILGECLKFSIEFKTYNKLRKVTSSPVSEQFGKTNWYKHLFHMRLITCRHGYRIVVIHNQADRHIKKYPPSLMQMKRTCTFFGDVSCSQRSFLVMWSHRSSMVKSEYSRQLLAVNYCIEFETTFISI